MLMLLAIVRRRSLWFTLISGVIWPLSVFSAAANTLGECALPASIDAEILVQRTLSCNAQLTASRYQWQARDAATDAAGKLDDPMLRYSVAPDTLSGPTERGEVIELSQTLPWPGKRRLEREAADAEAEAWRYQWQDEQVQLARRVRHGYAQWATTKALLQINQQHRQLWQEFIAIAETKYSTGQGTKNAVLQAKTQLQHLKHRAVQLEAEQQVIVAQLNRILNRPPDSGLGESTNFSLPAIAGALIEQRRAELDSQPLMRRLQSQRQSIAAQAARAEKERLPDFKLMAQRNTMWMNPDHQNMVGISMNIPFDFGKRSGRIGSLHAEEQALRWQQRELSNQLQEHIKQAQVRWNEALHILRLHENELLPLAEESLVTARDEYRSGTQGSNSGFLSLLTAEQFLLNTQQDYENARRDVLQRYADLLAALGLVTANNSTATLNLPSGISE